MVGETQPGYPQNLEELAADFNRRRVLAKAGAADTRKMIIELEIQLGKYETDERNWETAYDNLVNMGKTNAPKRRRSVDQQQQRAPNGKFGTKKQHKEEEEEEYDEGEE